MEFDMPKGVYERTEYHRKITSDGIKNKWKTKDYREKLEKSLKGRKFSEEGKKALSEGQKGRQGYWKGKHLSEDHKRKISETEKGKIPPWKGTKLSIDHKNKIMKSIGKYFENNKSSIELKVENQLIKYKIKYFSQKSINNGSFIIDFYLPEYQLVIECNGDYWHSRPERKERDQKLEEYVLSKGKDILWLWEHEINDEWFDISDYLEIESDVLLNV